MRKKVFGRKLSRNRNSRKALFRSLIRSFVLTGGITTTRAKAKSIVPDIDKLMGYVKADSVASRRLAMSKLGNDKEVAQKLFSDYMGLAKGRTSGYTRISQLPNRTGDNAPMVRLEWVEKPTPVAAAEKVEKSSKKPKKASSAKKEEKK